ncbi:MAG: lytic transglycosylase domain-containing protein [Gammaproteobacteria bacterium]|nr:lytic transglycosylase domain-containing protein [Gammaproteobacteria bacterium]
MDRGLKQRLVNALAIRDGLKDRFDMNVWITDMDGRLAPYIKEMPYRLALLQHVYQESLRANLPPELVLAVIHIESRFDQFAISRVGARGLMQIMPFWLNEIGRPEDNLFNIETNLRFGCTILRHYIDKESGDITRALARYNGSQGKRKYPDMVFEKLRHHWYRS